MAGRKGTSSEPTGGTPRPGTTPFRAARRNFVRASGTACSAKGAIHLMEHDLKQLEDSLTQIATGYAGRPAVHDLTISVVQPRTGLAWHWGDPDRQYLIASITKLYTTALVLQLIDEQRLDWDTTAQSLLGADIMRGLVMRRGSDHSHRVTIGHLLTHTSGIPDYYSGSVWRQRSLAGQLLRNKDMALTFEDILARARTLPGTYSPGDSTVARYSDTNFAILGRIVEQVTGTSFAEALGARLLAPLTLADTCLFASLDDRGRSRLLPAFHRQKRLNVPLALSSMSADGGLVATTNDQIRFARAFFGARCFSAGMLQRATGSWNRMPLDYWPLKYGAGTMMFSLPRWQTGGAPMPQLIGHSGSLGSFLFHAPHDDLFIAGTVNQTSPASLPYPLLARITLAVTRHQP
jgi:D-alanyl-D-alanine carboxypeptidase